MTTTAIVWAATWVPGPPPIPDAAGDGYAVAWIDTADGRRLQALVSTPAEPPIGCGGTTHRDDVLGVDLFVPDGSES